jgi:hypothetical protein
LFKLLIYVYIFSVFSFEPFEGGEKNLILSLQPSESVGNIFLEKLFAVFHLWYTGKDNSQELDKVNFNFIIISVCQRLLSWQITFVLSNIFKI